MLESKGIRSYPCRNLASTQCLRTTEVPNPLDLAALTSMELGQRYDADMQCSRRFGSGSVLCRVSLCTYFILRIVKAVD